MPNLSSMLEKRNALAVHNASTAEAQIKSIVRRIKEIVSNPMSAAEDSNVVTATALTETLVRIGQELEEFLGWFQSSPDCEWARENARAREAANSQAVAPAEHSVVPDRPDVSGLTVAAPSSKAQQIQ